MSVERLIDQAVASEIFGKKSCVCCHGATCDLHDGPRYTENLPDAMRILDHLRKAGHRVLINIDSEGFHLRRVISVAYDLSRDEKTYIADLPMGSVRKIEDLPMAISQGALKLARESKVSRGI